MGTRICDICNDELEYNAVGIIFYDYLYCPKCWEMHFKNAVDTAESKKICGDLEL